MKKIVLLLIITLSSIGIYAQETSEEALTENPLQYFKAEDFENGINEIVLYSLESCGRCETVRNALDTAGIEYFVFTIDNDKKQSLLDQKILQGLKYPNLGYSIKFPCLEINGKMYHAIANHTAFIRELIDFMKEPNEN
ncbi:MAG TPA: glutaredoxin domain-containing protein [Bacteroidales bacterium]|nr:glutaredoxin domain-containing protein [Bacteroidales bacterium]